MKTLQDRKNLFARHSNVPAHQEHHHSRHDREQQSSWLLTPHGHGHPVDEPGSSGSEDEASDASSWTDTGDIAEQLADEGIECEIVDPRTTSPLDEATIFESVENTGRLVVVDEANPRCSLATDIAARVAQNCFDDLKAAPKMVTAPHTPPPFSPTLEDLYVPDPERIAAAVREITGSGVAR